MSGGFHKNHKYYLQWGLFFSKVIGMLPACILKERLIPRLLLLILWNFLGQLSCTALLTTAAVNLLRDLLVILVKLMYLVAFFSRLFYSLCRKLHVSGKTLRNNKSWNYFEYFLMRVFIWHCLLIFFRPSKTIET